MSNEYKNEGEYSAEEITKMMEDISNTYAGEYNDKVKMYFDEQGKLIIEPDIYKV